MSNAKKYLFKRRRYGWGWTPVTWQGWIIVCVPLVLIIGTAFLLPRDADVSGILYYLGATLLLVVLMILVAAKTSPKPKWRWGKKDKDNSDEDF